MDLGIEGKWALVTGGTSGIGLAIARSLAAEGAHVCVASRAEQNIERALASLRSAYPQSKFEGLVLDLHSEPSLRAGARALLAQGILPDILVNNVGGPKTGSMLDLPLAAWDDGYASLLRGPIILCQELVPTMVKRGWGRLLSVTSTSARQIIPQLPISGTFRAGLSAWTKSLAREVGAAGVLVNNLLPGPTNTDRLKDLATKSPAYFNSMVSETAVRRIAEPEELGRVAAFLCSNANTYVTGTDVLVDGGYTGAL